MHPITVVTRAMVVRDGVISRTRRFDEIPIGFEQADAEDQGKRNPAPRGPHDSRLLSDTADFLFYRVQTVGRGQIAFVEQYGIGIAQLIVCSWTRETVESEIIGIGYRDDRID